jgi:hypothetical protein
MPANELPRTRTADEPRHERRATSPVAGPVGTWRVIRTLRLRLARRLTNQQNPWPRAHGDTPDGVAR